MTARTCFVDSVCWIALLNRADSLHTQANTVYQQRLSAGDQTHYHHRRPH